MSFVRMSKWLSVSIAALLLSACGSLGDGSKPESLEIRRPVSSALLGPTSNKAFVCFIEQMQAVAEDSEGRLGDFSSRVIWASSNPDVAQISNGEIQLPGDPTRAYASGVVIPKAAGTTTITARFSKLSASYELVVGEPSAISITPTSLSLARYSQSPFTLQAVIDGYTRDVTALARWTIDEAEESDTTTDIASIGSSGVVLANKTLGTLTARATLDACPAGSPSAALVANLTSAINVRALSSLSVAREFSAPLVIGTTEKFTITGHFDGTDQTQDLSLQIRFENVDAGGVVDTAGSAIAGGTSPANFVLASSVGTTRVRPRYPSADREDFPTVNGPISEVTTIERTFASFVVTPATATVAPFEAQQFRAIATYADGATQDITRHVAWTYPEDVLRELQREGIRDRFDLISIGGSYTDAGLVTSRQLSDSESTIRAIRGTGDDAVEQTATFTVDAP